MVAALGAYAGCLRPVRHFWILWRRHGWGHHSNSSGAGKRSVERAGRSLLDHCAGPASSLVPHLSLFGVVFERFFAVDSCEAAGAYRSNESGQRPCRYAVFGHRNGGPDPDLLCAVYPLYTAGGKRIVQAEERAGAGARDTKDACAAVYVADAAV